MPKSDKLLIVFVENPRLGYVKTALAKEIGAQKALTVYYQLMFHNNFIASMSDCDKAVFYSDEIENNDIWNDTVFQKNIQEGEDLGERMLHAVNWGFLKRYKRIVIIGCDCLEVDEISIEIAFSDLEENDVVLGPTTSGGYYLLGMKLLIPEIFVNKDWNTDNVLLDTLLDVKELGIKYKLLETLSNIDTLEELTKSGLKIE